MLGPVFDAYWLPKVAPDSLPMAQAAQPMLWLYGLYPLSAMTFVSGIGYSGPEHIHSGQMLAACKPEEAPFPGRDARHHERALVDAGQYDLPLR
jgi:hypothetical protein